MTKGMEKAIIKGFGGTARSLCNKDIIRDKPQNCGKQTRKRNNYGIMFREKTRNEKEQKEDKLDRETDKARKSKARTSF